MNKIIKLLLLFMIVLFAFSSKPYDITINHLTDTHAFLFEASQDETQLPTFSDLDKFYPYHANDLEHNTQIILFLMIVISNFIIIKKRKERLFPKFYGANYVIHPLL